MVRRKSERTTKFVNDDQTPPVQAQLSAPQEKSKEGKGKEKEKRKKRRKKPGQLALQQIVHLQRTTTLLLRKMPFARLVREIASNITHRPNLRFQYLALAALQEASEAYLIHLFEDTVIAAIHARRVTVKVEDMHLVLRLRGQINVTYP